MYAQCRNAYLDEGEDLGGHKFIPIDRVDNIVTKETIKTELKRKKKKLSLGRVSRVADRVHPDLKRVFLTLVHLDDPWVVKDILDAGITDDDLPLTQNNGVLHSANESKKRFKTPRHWTGPIVDQFLNKQWMMLAPVFKDDGKSIVLGQDCPLPFQNVEIQESGPSTIVYKAEIPRHHVDFKIDKPALQVALKEFRVDSPFDIERGNLDKIRELASNKHITKNLGCVSRGGKYFIIFPWAEGGDLDNFWQVNDGKERTPQLIQWSLEQMIGLSEALEALHDKIGKDANCRHGDLKPGNILHFLPDDEQGILKVSDFGISKIHLSATFERQGKGTVTRATSPSYEAPEALSNNNTRSRKYDIWSLGCIFLEFSIWIVQGCQAIYEFNEERKFQLRGYGAADTWSHFYKVSGDKPEVHPKVLQRIVDLKSLSPSRPKTALGDLLDIIENGLIKVDVRDRLAAKDLHSQLKEIVQRAKTDASYLSKF